jgi:plasmid stabilization system protein ParE
MPLAAPEHEGYRRPLRFRIYGSHMIYAVDGEDIIVSCVLHQLQEWQNLL